MLTIDLAAIQSNWCHLNKITSSQVAGVIKANAYGLGASQIGNALYSVGCREFFVATLEEALAARSFLPDEAIIYVLGGARSGSEHEFAAANLIPVLCSVSAVNNWVKVNLSKGVAAASAIKVNTGMTRFGLDIDEFKKLCTDESLLRICNPILLMSHLACADEPENPLNIFQQESFVECTRYIHSVLPGLRCSLANSSGIFLGDNWHFDLVRPGAALYGIAPQPDNLNPMSAVLKLRLPIIQVRKLMGPASVGYGAGFVLPEGRRIAVAAGGYADGLNRTVGRHPEGVLDGCVVHAVGRISMDATIFDVSGVPLTDDQLLQSSIEVIGDSLSLDYLSKKNNLLGYEVLTSLGNRYKRKYLPGLYNV